MILNCTVSFAVSSANTSSVRLMEDNSCWHADIHTLTYLNVLNWNISVVCVTFTVVLPLPLSPALVPSLHRQLDPSGTSASLTPSQRGFLGKDWQLEFRASGTWAQALMERQAVMMNHSERIKVCIMYVHNWPLLIPSSHSWAVVAAWFPAVIGYRSSWKIPDCTGTRKHFCTHSVLVSVCHMQTCKAHVSLWPLYAVRSSTAAPPGLWWQSGGKIGKPRRHSHPGHALASPLKWGQRSKDISNL